ncbi:MAG: hypothetical protein GX846_07215 [Deltaproteobacteria bacterium]|nr:hypothetical protein [Deltaproteobacteria bacterium]
MLKNIAVLCLFIVFSIPVISESHETCDRTCLEKWVDKYLAAMRDQDKNPEMFAPDLKFTEDGVRLPFGNEGLWYSMSGIGNYKFYVPDVETQQVAFLGTVREKTVQGGEEPLSAIALRLKISSNRITEIDQIVIRPDSINSSAGDFPPTGPAVEAMGAPHPIFKKSIPEDKRMSRKELIKTADYYFTGLENNDGKGYYPFTDDCIRFENGVDVLLSTNKETGEKTRTTCKKQFEEGVKGIVTRIRDRRFVAVDREKGIVFSFAFFDHDFIHWTWQLAELFKIENGQIRRIEAIFHRAPYGMNSGWSTFEKGISNEIQEN